MTLKLAGLGLAIVAITSTGLTAFDCSAQQYYAPQQRYVYPMPNSTPYMVQPSPYGGAYRAVQPYVIRGGRYVGGSYMMQKGYPAVGKIVRGGPVGTFFGTWLGNPGCAGEGCR